MVESHGAGREEARLDHFFPCLRISVGVGWRQELADNAQDFCGNCLAVAERSCILGGGNDRQQCAPLDLGAHQQRTHDREGEQEYAGKDEPDQQTRKGKGALQCDQREGVRKHVST
jgi:hypothetical protein